MSLCLPLPPPYSPLITKAVIPAAGPGTRLLSTSKEQPIIEAGVYLGPFTSIGNTVTIKRREIENSIIMDHCTIDVEERIIDSLIGPRSQITSNFNNRPRGRRFIFERPHP